MSNPLEFTGERFTPECVREIWYEHIHRYAFATELVSDKRVLDAACGEGYGAAHLARAARSVAAVDISEASISHARQRYQAGNLEFQIADCCNLPYADDEFDCVVSFETLEHLENQAGLLKEFRRVLGPGGFLLISSPDKSVYTDRYDNENEFHVRELYRNELEQLIAGQFPVHRLLRQKLLFHSAIWSDEPGLNYRYQQAGDDEITSLPGPGHDAMYFIAICAADESALPDLGGQLWLFDDAAESVYQHYHHEIRKNMSAGTVLAEMERELEQLKSRLQDQLQAPEKLSWWRRMFRNS